MNTFPRIDPYLFERQLAAFKQFVEERSRAPFDSFEENPYIEGEEGYKYQIHQAGQKALGIQHWTSTDIGHAIIAEAVIKAIQLPKNNLVPQGQYGPSSQLHRPLIDALQDPEQLYHIENVLFRLYLNDEDKQSFNELIDFFGRKYPLLAYLFFLKDFSRFLPIAPETFERAFGYLGVEFEASGRCSWENYTEYLGLISEIRSLLTENLVQEITLLDAHSFVWILARQLRDTNRLIEVQEYQISLPWNEKPSSRPESDRGHFASALLTHLTQPRE